MRINMNCMLKLCLLASISPAALASSSSTSRLATSLKASKASASKASASASTLAFHNNNHLSSSSSSIEDILNIRGGASKQRQRKKNKSASLSSLDSSKRRSASGAKSLASKSASAENQSAISNTMKKYKAILPLTRLYITMVGVSTLAVVILGEETGQTLLGLDPIRTLYGLELWRPFTAASFLGKPSVGWLMSAYYLFEYGSSLERVYGTAQHFLFLIGQVVLLTAFSMLFGQPFFGSSVITSMLHVLSRSMPHQKVKWLIFTVPYWTLPYGLMASDVLQGGAAAALPHVLGIITGHMYYFHKFIWPKMGGENWLVAPQFLIRRLEPDSSAALEAGRKSVENALKNRKKGKGRKLSG